MKPVEVAESRINIIGEGSRIEGDVVLDEIARVHGVIVGQVQAKDGSTLILGETAMVEGTIHADTLIVDGFVRGDIIARRRVVISRTGRVVGTVATPLLKLEFGSYFEGRCRMEAGAASAPGPAPSLAPAPV